MLIVGCNLSKTNSDITDSNTKITDKTSLDKFANKGTDKKIYALITQTTGNHYYEKQATGFKEVIEAKGDIAIVCHPDPATAYEQVSIIKLLMAQGVDSICIAANDENALQSVLKEAMNSGIKVLSIDSKVNPSSRQVFVNQASANEIGNLLMDAVLDISGGSGDWAILSASSQAANQNSWIEDMKKVMQEDKYSDLNLVEVSYGDDESKKSEEKTRELLSKYPNLKVICSPTAVGIAAAAKVLDDEKSNVKLTGLGLPSEMAEYIGNKDKICPYMYLWNPIDLGRLGAYTSIELVKGSITGESGDKFSTKDMGEYTVEKSTDGGTEVILGTPIKFDSTNIDKWKNIY
jgi:rhamnose transport system substrate-binding protein